jgi:hypothetical protein
MEAGELLERLTTLKTRYRVSSDARAPVRRRSRCVGHGHGKLRLFPALQGHQALKDAAQSIMHVIGGERAGLNLGHYQIFGHFYNGWRHCSYLLHMSVFSRLIIVNIMYFKCTKARV